MLRYIHSGKKIVIKRAIFSCTTSVQNGQCLANFNVCDSAQKPLNLQCSTFLYEPRQHHYMTSKMQAIPLDSRNVPVPDIANHMARSPFPESSMSTPVPSSSRNKHPSNARTRTLDRVESDAFFSTPASQAMPTINSRLLDHSGLNPYPAASPPTKHASRRMTSDSDMKSRRSKLEILNDPLLHQTFLYQSRGSTEDLFPSHLVGFAEYGNPDGHAVILIGGLGCSRLVGVMFHDISKRYGVRLIIPERMG